MESNVFRIIRAKTVFGSWSCVSLALLAGCSLNNFEWFHEKLDSCIDFWACNDFRYLDQLVQLSTLNT